MRRNRLEDVRLRIGIIYNIAKLYQVENLIVVILNSYLGVRLVAVEVGPAVPIRLVVPQRPRTAALLLKINRFGVVDINQLVLQKKYRLIIGLYYLTFFNGLVQVPLQYLRQRRHYFRKIQPVEELLYIDIESIF